MTLTRLVNAPWIKILVNLKNSCRGKAFNFISDKSDCPNTRVTDKSSSHKQKFEVVRRSMGLSTTLIPKDLEKNYVLQQVFWVTSSISTDKSFFINQGWIEAWMEKLFKNQRVREQLTEIEKNNHLSEWRKIISGYFFPESNYPRKKTFLICQRLKRT